MAPRGRAADTASRANGGADMLIFTNRKVQDRADETAFERSFAPGMSHLALANVAAAPAGAGWEVSGLRPDAADAEALNALLPLFTGRRPLLVYLHGNSN